jgi:uncharacterized membrane protein YedE/YeeE
MPNESELHAAVRRIPRATAVRKERRSQLPWAIAVALLVIALALYIAQLGPPKFVFLWIVGVALGIALQRSRFCFTAAMRDPVLTGSTSLAKAVIVGLAVGTVGFAALQLGAYFKAGQMADALKVASGSLEPVGLHTVVGGVLFGAGAVIAGGCASGTLMRVGEGFLQQWLVLPFFVLGSALAAATWPTWKAALAVQPDRTVYLPKALGGFVPALVLQFALLFALWLAADWWGRRGHAARQP